MSAQNRPSLADADPQLAGVCRWLPRLAKTSPNSTEFDTRRSTLAERWPMLAKAIGRCWSFFRRRWPTSAPNPPTSIQLGQTSLPMGGGANLDPTRPKLAKCLPTLANLDPTWAEARLPEQKTSTNVGELFGNFGARPVRPGYLSRAVRRATCRQLSEQGPCPAEYGPQFNLLSQSVQHLGRIIESCSVVSLAPGVLRNEIEFIQPIVIISRQDAHQLSCRPCSRSQVDGEHAYMSGCRAYDGLSGTTFTKEVISFHIEKWWRPLPIAAATQILQLPSLVELEQK